MTNAHHPIADQTFLITGGASRIGSHIADRLLAEGAKKVRLFDNFSPGNAATIAHLRDDPRAPLLRGDVADIVLRLCSRTDLKPDLKHDYRVDTRSVQPAMGARLGFSRLAAAREIDWKPQVDIESGIARLLAWQRGEPPNHRTI